MDFRIGNSMENVIYKHTTFMTTLHYDRLGKKLDLQLILRDSWINSIAVAGGGVSNLLGKNVSKVYSSMLLAFMRTSLSHGETEFTLYMTHTVAAFGEEP